MTDDRLSAAVRQQVAERAGQRCEYCLLPSVVAFFPHEVDHVVARKHGGTSDVTNLALACWRCNRHKGSDLATLDRKTGSLFRLFDPRMQRWSDHFRLDAAEVIGLSAVGRATIQLLQLNTRERVTERKRLIAAKAFQAPSFDYVHLVGCKPVGLKGSHAPRRRASRGTISNKRTTPG